MKQGKECEMCGGQGAKYEPRISYYGDYYESESFCEACDGTGWDKKYLMDIIAEDVVQNIPRDSDVGNTQGS